jgi:hypothetical protein
MYSGVIIVIWFISSIHVSDEHAAVVEIAVKIAQSGNEKYS